MIFASKSAPKWKRFLKSFQTKKLSSANIGGTACCGHDLASYQQTGVEKL